MFNWTAEQKTSKLIGAGIMAVSLVFGYGILSGHIIATLPGLVGIYWGMHYWNKHDPKPTEEELLAKRSKSTQVSSAVAFRIIGLFIAGLIGLLAYALLTRQL